MHYWSSVVDAPRDRVLKPTIKRHNPKTVRKKVGESYQGCLVVKAHRSANLYHRIEGWVRAIMLGSESAVVALQAGEEAPL